ncbi:hypothetical protein J1N35_005896 [Gossypium stocksii]|uniref:Secreted protein n=1 Tax=Gossypium stocksii TaxID=47602 RepID=A0A9D4AJQ2_9ROSI|nr:hypothetical protein J1N35_005896 [Gossypium stocksii]
MVLLLLFQNCMLLVRPILWTLDASTRWVCFLALHPPFVLSLQAFTPHRLNAFFNGKIKMKCLLKPNLR